MILASASRRRSILAQNGLEFPWICDAMNDVMGNLRKLSQALSGESQSPDWRVLTETNREIGVPGASDRRIAATFRTFLRKIEICGSTDSRKTDLPARLVT